MPEEQQDEIAHAYTHQKTYYGHGLTYLSTDKVKNIAAALEALGKLLCAHGGRCADVAQGKRTNILEKLTESAWSYAPCGNTCCADCSELGTCKQVCPMLLAKQDAMKTKKRADQRAERERQAEADRAVIGEIKELWRRFGVARAAAGKSVAECYNAADVVYGVPDADEVTRLENGEAKYATNTKLPYGYSCYLSDIHRFTRVADLLGVSLDYLCGLTDDPAPKPPTLFSVDLCSPVWQPLDAAHWPEEGALVVLGYETGLGGSSYLVARCAGGADDEYPFISTDAGTTVDDIVECRCDRWMPLAECRRGGEGA